MNLFKEQTKQLMDQEQMANFQAIFGETATQNGNLNP